MFVGSWFMVGGFSVGRGAIPEAGTSRQAVGSPAGNPFPTTTGGRWHKQDPGVALTVCRAQALATPPVPAPLDCLCGPPPLPRGEPWGPRPACFPLFGDLVGGAAWMACLGGVRGYFA